MDQRLVLINTINHQRSAPPHVVDTLICQLLHPRGLHDYIKPIWVILLQLLPLCVGILPIQLNILVSRVELFGDIHLDTLVRCNDDPGGAVKLEELRKDKPGRASTKEEDFDADWRGEFVEAVDGTSSGFEEGGFFIGEVVDFVELFLLAVNKSQ
jgi:hypothetical protein